MSVATAQIDLDTALKLISTDDDEDVVYLRRAKNTPSHRPDEILSLKEVRNKYDMKRTMVTNIRPYFPCGDYEGMLLTITEQEVASNG